MPRPARSVAVLTLAVTTLASAWLASDAAGTAGPTTTAPAAPTTTRPAATTTAAGQPATTAGSTTTTLAGPAPRSSRRIATTVDTEKIRPTSLPLRAMGTTVAVAIGVLAIGGFVYGRVRSRVPAPAGARQAAAPPAPPEPIVSAPNGPAPPPPEGTPLPPPTDAVPMPPAEPPPSPPRDAALSDWAPPQQP